MAGVKCCVLKTRFFGCPGRLWNRTREARALCGFQHHKGENLFYLLFYDPIIVGLGRQRCQAVEAFAMTSSVMA